MTNDQIHTSSIVEIELLRATERQRLRALVDANMEVANQLHADDFQLVNPAGQTLSKEQYLGWIASGMINYLVWEPGEIAVRLHGDLAILRYQAQMEIIVDGQQSPPNRLWHMDVYEKRSGCWQVVWSQATGIRQ
ncbi:MAG: nuclear transport factor 2 family protein [Caldilineaceae bacterium]